MVTVATGRRQAESTLDRLGAGTTAQQTRIALILAALFLSFCKSRSADDCSLPDTEGLSRSHPVCQFYMGTSHYRAEEYSEAAALWRGLVERERFPGTIRT